MFRSRAAEPPSHRAAVLLLVTLAACVPRLPPLPMPVGLAETSPDAAARWADSTRPSERRDIRFRFQLQHEHGGGGGEGRARLAPPDSIRLDARGPFGAGRVSAFVAGDSAVWAEPPDEIGKLVPNYTLFWAMLGIARPPEPGSDVRARADDRVAAWQYAAGGDTVEYIREYGPSSRLIAEVRQHGRRIGRVETRFGPDGLPASSRLVVLKPAAKLDLTFTQHAKADAFAPDTWLPSAAREP